MLARRIAMVAPVLLLAVAATFLASRLRAPALAWNLAVRLGRASDHGGGPATIPMTCLLGYRGDPAAENARGALLAFRRATGGPTDLSGPDLRHGLTLADFASLLAYREDAPCTDAGVRDAVRTMWTEFSSRVDNPPGGHDDR